MGIQQGLYLAPLPLLPREANVLNKSLPHSVAVASRDG